MQAQAGGGILDANGQLDLWMDSGFKGQVNGEGNHDGK
jgi:hypothetical protein